MYTQSHMYHSTINGNGDFIVIGLTAKIIQPFYLWWMHSYIVTITVI